MSNVINLLDYKNNRPKEVTNMQLPTMSELALK